MATKIKIYFDVTRLSEKKQKEYGKIIYDSIESCFQNFSASEFVMVYLLNSPQMRWLNLNHRNKDSITDVLSFCYEEGKYINGIEQKEYKPNSFFAKAPNPLLGEIHICLRAVRDNARNHNEQFTTELARVSIHATLHLLGFDHPEGVEIDEMLKNHVEMIELQEALLEKSR